MSSNKVGGLSGIIGELAACDGLRANWDPSDGFDAIAQNGLRVQIKTRRRRIDRDKSPRMGRFKPTKSGAYHFDVEWYVELDELFNLSGIWETSKEEILRLQEGSDKGLPVNKYKTNARQILP
jgi:hypothetical protein